MIKRVLKFLNLILILIGFCFVLWIIWASLICERVLKDILYELTDYRICFIVYLIFIYIIILSLLYFQKFSLKILMKNSNKYIILYFFVLTSITIVLSYIQYEELVYIYEEKMHFKQFLEDIIYSKEFISRYFDKELNNVVPFYKNKVLSKTFIIDFLNSLNWAEYKMSNNVTKEICNDFINYVNNSQEEYNYHLSSFFVSFNFIEMYFVLKKIGILVCTFLIIFILVDRLHIIINIASYFRYNMIIFFVVGCRLLDNNIGNYVICNMKIGYMDILAVIIFISITMVFLNKNYYRNFYLKLLFWVLVILQISLYLIFYINPLCFIWEHELFYVFRDFSINEKIKYLSDISNIYLNRHSFEEQDKLQFFYKNAIFISKISPDINLSDIHLFTKSNIIEITNNMVLRNYKQFCDMQAYISCNENKILLYDLSIHSEICEILFCGLIFIVCLCSVPYLYLGKLTTYNVIYLLNSSLLLEDYIIIKKLFYFQYFNSSISDIINDPFMVTFFIS